MKSTIACLLVAAALSGCAADPRYGVTYAYYGPWTDETPEPPARVVQRPVEGVECARPVSYSNQGMACPTCASFPVTGRSHGECR